MVRGRSHRFATNRASKRPRGCSATLTRDFSAKEPLTTGSKPKTWQGSAVGPTLITEQPCRHGLARGGGGKGGGLPRAALGVALQRSLQPGPPKMAAWGALGCPGRLGRVQTSFPQTALHQADCERSRDARPAPSPAGDPAGAGPGPGRTSQVLLLGVGGGEEPLGQDAAAGGAHQLLLRVVRVLHQRRRPAARAAAPRRHRRRLARGSAGAGAPPPANSGAARGPPRPPARPRRRPPHAAFRAPRVPPAPTHRPRAGGGGGGSRAPAEGRGEARRGQRAASPGGEPRNHGNVPLGRLISRRASSPSSSGLPGPTAPPGAPVCWGAVGAPPLRRLSLPAEDESNDSTQGSCSADEFRAKWPRDSGRLISSLSIPCPQFEGHYN